MAAKDRFIPTIASGSDVAREIKQHILAIGDWDMDTNQTLALAHGIDLSLLLGVQGHVVNDAGTAKYGINQGKAVSSIYVSPFISSIDATNINLEILTGSFFDSVDFNATSYNRGYIIFTLVTS